MKDPVKRKRQATKQEKYLHTTYRMGKYLEYKKNSQNSTTKKSYQKTSKRYKQRFHQRRYTDSKSKHEKIFNIISREIQIKTKKE